MDSLALLAKTMPFMPAQSGWLAIVLIILLGAVAGIDAVTGKIPDPLVLPSLLVVTGIQGFYVSWPFAGRRLLLALFVGFLIYLANEIYYRATKRDALGMGDAKWTVLAVAGFGLAPSLMAWGLGAWLALFWMAGTRLIRHKIRHVHFAPFLFFGLLVGIWYFRLRA